MRRPKAKAGLWRSPRGLHIRTLLSSLLKLSLDSSLKTTWFHSIAVQSRRARFHSKQRCRRWVSLAAHLMGAVIPDVLQPGAFRWFGKTKGSVVKMLPVSGQRPKRQLAQHLRVVKCDGFLED
ncbi:e3 ubiquitin-protein ligase RNF13 [Trichonephila clavipes]|nr:e3 ubiquitin-protein ligase RNF13 [Trichonephila clavipes]